MPGRNKRASVRYFHAVRCALAVTAAGEQYEPPPCADEEEDDALDPYRARTYRLEGRTPVACAGPEWAMLFESDSYRRIAATRLDGGVYVSTVFLGIDHNFRGRGRPVLFETMAFSPDPDGPRELMTGQMCEDVDGLQVRYRTYDEAEEGHARIVALIEKNLETIR